MNLVSHGGHRAEGPAPSRWDISFMLGPFLSLKELGLSGLNSGEKASGLRGVNGPPWRCHVRSNSNGDGAPDLFSDDFRTDQCANVLGRIPKFLKDLSGMFA